MIARVAFEDREGYRGDRDSTHRDGDDNTDRGAVAIHGGKEWDAYGGGVRKCEGQRENRAVGSGQLAEGACREVHQGIDGQIHNTQYEGDLTLPPQQWLWGAGDRGEQGARDGKTHYEGDECPQVLVIDHITQAGDIANQ